ncbi:MAG: hypothetical protein KME05_23930 [Gloeocapsa sp. UFS-A4-WI-NPMV-4B04]|jgi:hypothetical protein|nr:hypothetical protein [Gloeocapsa sp. UFS-A4-WI-NPMV-4B04]
MLDTSNVFCTRSYNVAIAQSLYDYLTKTVERLATDGVKSENRHGVFI